MINITNHQGNANQNHNEKQIQQSWRIQNQPVKISCIYTLAMNNESKKEFKK